MTNLDQAVTQPPSGFANDASGGHHPSMLKAALRSIVVVASLLAIGPLAAMLINSLRDADGGRAVTLLVNGNLGGGLAAGAVVFVAAAIVGLAASHFLSLNTGLMSAGIILAWGRWGEGTLEGVVRRAGNGKDLTMLAVEGLVVTLIAAALTRLMVKVAHNAQHPDSKPSGALIAGPDGASIWPMFFAVLLAGAAAAGVITWLLSVSGAKGQTFAAAVLGAIAAGATAQVIASSKGFHAMPATPMLSIALVALVGPLVAMVMHGAGLIDAVYSGKVFSLARPFCLDWAAGALLGVPIGLGWAGSMLDRRHQ